MVRINDVKSSYKNGSDHEMKFKWRGTVENGRQTTVVKVSGTLKARDRSSLEKKIDKTIRKELKKDHFDKTSISNMIERSVKRAGKHNEVKKINMSLFGSTPPSITIQYSAPGQRPAPQVHVPQVRVSQFPKFPKFPQSNSFPRFN